MQNLAWVFGLFAAIAVVAWAVLYAMTRNRRLTAAEMQLRKESKLPMDRDIDDEED